jgi:hypothetical protein
MPALQAGWNLLAYPVPATRTVSLALASIADDYTTVMEEDNSKGWLVYDQTVLSDHPEFAPFVNSLDYLTFGHSYWIYAVTNTVPFLGVPGDRTATPSISLPPATIYGWVVPPDNVTVAAGDAVTAVINNTVCGSGIVTDTVGIELAYKVFVKADTGDGCGAAGRVVNFVINGHTFAGAFHLPSDGDWNRQAWFHSLGMGQQLFLPLIVNNLPLKAPDLVVQEITIEGAAVQVVIANQGLQAVSADAAYWVDLYVNPTAVPQLNDSWQNLGDQGIAWGVVGKLLAPGEILTLTLNDAYFMPSFSYYPGEPAAGSVIYVQVDAINTETTYGAVREEHEITGGPYNNVTGIVYIPQLV